MEPVPSSTVYQPQEKLYRKSSSVHNVLKLQDKICISAYLFSLGLDNQDPAQWGDAELSHLVVPEADYASDSEEEGEEEEEEQQQQQRRGGGASADMLLFITAVPNTKLCAWGEEDSGGHVL